VSLADAVTTVVNIRAHYATEGNPAMAWLMRLAGLVPALLIAKLGALVLFVFAPRCGALRLVGPGPGRRRHGLGGLAQSVDLAGPSCRRGPPVTRPSFARRHSGKIAAGGIVGAISVAAAVVNSAPAAIEVLSHFLPQREAEGRPGHPGQSYPDPYYGHARETICYGHTGGVRPGTRMTHAQCLELLRQDLQVYATGAMACLHVRMPAPTLAAFIDVAYNVGPERFCRRSPSVALANAGDLRAACNALIQYNRHGRVVGWYVTSNGQPLPRPGAASGGRAGALRKRPAVIAVLHRPGAPDRRRASSAASTAP
jgi:GH24 family phage-related lysozyme (muramidase)